MVWSQEEENQVVVRECVVCQNKATCAILDMLISVDAKMVKPKEWIPQQHGVIYPHCTQFEGSALMMIERDKQEASAARLQERKDVIAVERKAKREEERAEQNRRATQDIWEGSSNGTILHNSPTETDNQN